MNRVVLLGAMLASPIALAESEHFEQIRVDAGMTASSVAIDERSGGGVVAEIKAMVHDYVAVGGRVEIAMMFGGRVGTEEEPLDLAMAASGLLEVEVFAGIGPIRPFAGIGIGGYTIGAQTVQDAGIRQETGRYFGIAPQLGIDLGRVRLAATYNAILGASIELRQMVGTVERTTRLSQNYLSLELSFRFGGGRKPAVQR